MLLQRGAKVNQVCGSKRDTVLHIAMRNMFNVQKKKPQLDLKPTSRESTIDITKEKSQRFREEAEKARKLREDQFEIVKLLLEHGADYRIMNLKLKTPLAFATKEVKDMLYLN